MLIYEGEITTAIQTQLLSSSGYRLHYDCQVILIKMMHSLQLFYITHAGRLSFDELGQRQKERRAGVIRDKFKDFSQHLPLSGLELVSLQFDRMISHKTLTINIQKCGYAQ